MMKRIPGNIPLSAAVWCSLLFLLHSCSVETSEQEEHGQKTKVVSIEASAYNLDTRTVYDSEGNFNWSSGERIAVRSSDRYEEFTLTSGEGTHTAIFKGEVDKEVVTTYALYPWREDYASLSIDGHSVSFILPSDYYGYAAGLSDLPMYAHIPDIDSGTAFFHPLTGVLRYTIKNPPAGTASLTFITDVDISGEGRLNLEDKAAPFIETPDGEQYVTFHFKTPLTGDSTITVDVPLPAGEYRAFAVDAKDTAGVVLKTVNFLRDLKMVVGHIQNISIDYTSSSSALSLPATGLPSIVILTPEEQPVTSKETWIEGALYGIRNYDGTLDAFGITSVKGRGNSSWQFFPKKSYSLKLDRKTEIMGMTKHKRWVLSANWVDRTSIRNAVSFELARKCKGLEWTPRGQFAELILNGEHKGYYYLCEQIKVDKNRVNIAELDPSATEGEGITGGYLMEVDRNYDEVYKFKSSVKELPYMFKDPDEVNSAQFQYMEQYVNDMEESLYVDSCFTAGKFEQYMNLESFCDYWLVTELAMNIEPSRARSLFMYKDKNGKMTAGPVWDFDYKTYTPGYSKSFVFTESPYYDRLLEDNTFRADVKERWANLKPALPYIYNFIDSLTVYLTRADSVNHTMWPTSSNVNGDEKLGFGESTQRLKQMLSDKADFLDEQISSW